MITLGGTFEARDLFDKTTVDKMAVDKMAVDKMTV
jgi:hypothetical protein